MRRLKSWIIRLGSALALAFVGALLGTVSPVDDRPFLGQPYRQSTLNRLDSTPSWPSSVTGPARAGFGRVELTPQLVSSNPAPAQGRFSSIPLAGYGARSGKPATGSLDPLWVKAVALETREYRIVWVAIDALIIPREVTEIVTTELARDPGLSRDELYLGASHTHGSLGGWGEGFVAEAFAGPFTPGVRDWMAGCIVAATRQALTNLAPVHVGSGSFQAPGQIRNRLVQEAGRVDAEFSLLKFNRTDGSSAVIGTYGAHATVLGADNMSFSGDYPGAWARHVEQLTGATALFIAGGVGSHSARSGPGSPTERVENLGHQLALDTVQALSRIQTSPDVLLTTIGLPVDLPEPNIRLVDDFRLRPWLSRRLVPTGSKTFLQAVRINDSIWVSTPCDFSGELALTLKEHACTLGRNLTVTSFNGDYIGYVIPSKYYHLGGYEPQTMSFFGPALPDYFDDLIRRMMAGL